MVGGRDYVTSIYNRAARDRPAADAIADKKAELGTAADPADQGTVSLQQAGGMVAALPHCDAFVSGHSLAALDEVAAAIHAQGE